MILPLNYSYRFLMFGLINGVLDLLLFKTPMPSDTVETVDSIDDDDTPKNQHTVTRVRGYVPDEEDNMTANDWRNLNK